MKKLFAFIATLVLLVSAVVRAELPPLIPRQLLFGTPMESKMNPQISPDGRLLSYTAPDSGVYNIWVRTLGKQDDRLVTRETKRSIYGYYWQPDSEHVLYLQDQNGDENVHLYQVNVHTQRKRDLTPFKGVQAQVVRLDSNYPYRMLVALNLEDRSRHDVYRLNLKSGALELDARNPGDVTDWIADNHLQVRAAQATTPDGGTEIRVRSTRKSKWRSFQKWGPGESPGWVQGFTPDSRGLWTLSSVGANARRLMEFRLDSGKGQVIAEDPAYDVDDVQQHPTHHTIEAVEVTRARAEWTLIEQRLKPDFELLKAACDGDFSVEARDLADSKWVVSYDCDTNPGSYYLYDRAQRRMELLFRQGPPDLLKYTFARMQPISFTARDGLSIHGYLTLPVGVEPRHLPMILVVHGGPSGRYAWGYNRFVQWLANRGYAVLQVNFRGSTGYGKLFFDAGDREWGGKMQDDLTDGKRWAVRQGYADPKRVAIWGHSYGGYAVLAGLAFTPDEFACGVDSAGPANLLTLLQTTPEYWAPRLAELKQRMGDWEKDPDFFKARSPVYHADRIHAPLLVIQGANDPRVKQAQADEMVQAVRKAGGQVQYLLFRDEGHGTSRPENIMRGTAAEEAFLARHLGGRFEPASDREKWEDLMK
jgi:dipeptidyl aminopeptidase/acylaminoacyl peptidase